MIFTDRPISQLAQRFHPLVSTLSICTAKRAVFARIVRSPRDEKIRRLKRISPPPPPVVKPCQETRAPRSARSTIRARREGRRKRRRSIGRIGGKEINWSNKRTGRPGAEIRPELRIFQIIGGSERAVRSRDASRFARRHRA